MSSDLGMRCVPLGAASVSGLFHDSLGCKPYCRYDRCAHAFMSAICIAAAVKQSLAWTVKRTNGAPPACRLISNGITAGWRAVPAARPTCIAAREECCRRCR